MHIRTLCLFYLLTTIHVVAYSQNDTGIVSTGETVSNLIIMRPTTRAVDELTVMTRIPDTAASYIQCTQIFKESVIPLFLDLYNYAQIYLSKLDSNYQIEPPYLALTDKDGGFARWGFILEDDGIELRKDSIAYIDITEERIWSAQNKLMSVTQLYPHEMGHVLYRLLSKKRKQEQEPKGVDMHFFSVKTDYSTAFNEGFAEHLENIARLFEPNEEIKNGIFEDIKSIEEKSLDYIQGFRKDFLYPWRMGLYKASMLNWYQKYEDYKRHALAFSGDIRYKNAGINLANVEDRLSYRNAGVELDMSQIRNDVQLLATEGLVSAFFTRLSTSDLANVFRPAPFYSRFLPDSLDQDFHPSKYFSPLENQFLKYFVVINEFVSVNFTETAQLLDFINGYIELFPDEGEQILRIYRDVTLSDLPDHLPTQIWIMEKNHNHRLLAFDPFDAITIPVYTFELNSAEVEDFMAVKGLNNAAALNIIKHRNKNGFFESLDQIKEVKGLSEEAKKILLDKKFDQEYYNTLTDPQLSINSLITAPIKHLLIKGMYYFVVFFGLLSWFFRKSHTTTKSWLLIGLKYLLLWVFMIFLGLTLVFLTPSPIGIWIVVISLFCIIIYLVFRNNTLKLHRNLIMTLIMGLTLLLSFS